MYDAKVGELPEAIVPKRSYGPSSQYFRGTA